MGHELRASFSRVLLSSLETDYQSNWYSAGLGTVRLTPGFWRHPFQSRDLRSQHSAAADATRTLPEHLRTLHQQVARSVVYGTIRE